MKTKRSQSALRDEAEKILQEKRRVFAADSEDLKSILEELHIHQIELELQNEELRLAQRELETSRNNFFDLYHFAPVAYLALDEKAVILECNLKAAEMLSLERRALLRKAFHGLIISTDQQRF